MSHTIKIMFLRKNESIAHFDSKMLTFARQRSESFSEAAYEVKFLGEIAGHQQSTECLIILCQHVLSTNEIEFLSIYSVIRTLFHEPPNAIVRKVYPPYPLIETAFG